jgi:hypothetical protein
MKTHKFLSTLLVVAFALAPQLLNISHGAFAASGGYSATLISPAVGQVLYPGQRFRIQWDATFPDMKNLHLCEMEIWLSLDGGRTWATCITPALTPRNRYFDWTVPNMPTNAAVLDIRFGCEVYYPESYSPQPASTFVIANSTAREPATH